MSHNKESSTNHQNHQYNNGVLQNNFSQHPSGIQPFAPNYQPPPYQTPFHLNSFNHPNPVSQQPQLHPPQPFDQPPPYNSTPQSGPQPSQPHYRAYPVIGPPNINSNKNNEYTVAIILSLVAYCFFGFVFGLIAFIFASMLNCFFMYSNKKISKQTNN